MDKNVLYLDRIWSLFIENRKRTIMMKDFTPLSAKTKVINSPEYQEYLEYLEEEAMSKNPDDFVFEKPDKAFYSQDELDVFTFMNDYENGNYNIDIHDYDEMTIISTAI